MKRSSDGLGPRPFKRKTGRTELRTTSRTMRRGQPKILIKSQETHTQDTSSEEEQSEDEDSAKGRSASSSSAKAYSALLALLDNEPSTLPELAENSAPLVQKETSSDDESDQHEEDIQLEDELPSDSDEVEENGTFDPFVFHFNQEDRIDKDIQAFKNRMAELQSRKNFSSETARYVQNEDNYICTSTGYEDIAQLKDVPAKPNSFWSSVNIKKKIKEAFSEEDISELDYNWIKGMLQYQNVNLQYLQNKNLENNYRRYYLLHCLNHVLRTRDSVLSNNEKKQKYLKKISEGADKNLEEPELRDQGYTRAKVLILVPTRNAAWEVINELIALSSLETVENKGKFKAQYYHDFDLGSVSDKRPDDFVKFFKGNSNDFFSIGVKFTRKTIKLYSTFLQSDIIVASPLGLKVLLEGDNNKKIKEKGNGFLSSIEIAILDEAHGLLMQNWEHVSTIFGKYVGKPPSSRSEELAKTIDFSRVRMWAINGEANFLTQIMSFSKYTTPEINNLVFNKSQNIAGYVSVRPLITDVNSAVSLQRRRLLRGGVLSKDVQLKQVFMRFDCDTPLQDPDQRLAHFKNVVLPQVRSKASYNNGTLIYVSSYVDYLRLKNYLQNDTNVGFLAVDEYSTQSSLTRNRALFERKPSSNPFILYTERLHFYKRYNIKGVKNVIFYGLPTDPTFYSEILDFIVKNKVKSDLAQIQDELGEDESENDIIDLNLSMVRIMFSKFDRLKLEKVVGSRAAGELCQGKSEMYEFK